MAELHWYECHGVGKKKISAPAKLSQMVTLADSFVVPPLGGFNFSKTNREATADDENDFEPNKLYPVLEPLPNDPAGHLRIIDESGEDYLYPEVYFQIVQVGEQARENLLRYFETAAA